MTAAGPSQHTAATGSESVRPLPILRDMPAATPSGRRLGGAVLAYLVTVTLLITWAPFDFAARPQHGLTSLWTWSDLLLNVLMFVPLGFLWQAATREARGEPRVATGTHRAVLPAFLVGALLSGIIETGQLFLADRFTSLLDVLSNAVGAMLGAWALRRLQSRLQVTSGTVRALALDLPLSGVIVLLLPLLWTWSVGDDGPARTPLLWMAAYTGGVLIGSVHGSYLSTSSRARDASVAATAWLLVGAMPTVLRSPSHEVLLHSLGAALLAALVSGWRSDRAARQRRIDGTQRVEYRALRLAMPTFAVYLTLCALWPLTAIDGLWRAAWMLAPAATALSRGLLLSSLAHLAAFTVVGYVTAEFHGRDNQRFVASWPRVVRTVVPLAILLEWARGWNATIGASGIVFALAVASGLFGGWLYHLQRDHVRALRERSVTGAVDGSAIGAGGRAFERDPFDVPLAVKSPA